MFGISKDIWKGYSFKEKLYVMCEKVHILKIAQFINRKILRNKPAVPTIEPAVQTIEPIAKTVEETLDKEQQKKDAWTDLERTFENSIQKFLNIIPSNRQKVIFSGHNLEFDKGTCSYLNKLAEGIAPSEMILLSHAVNVQNVKADKLIHFNYFTLPYTLTFNRYPKNQDIILPKDVEDVIESKEYLIENYKKVEMRHKDMGENYAKAMVYWLYRYYISFLEHFKPSLIILWCEFYCGHSFLKNICEERNIRVIYMEFGAIPGTFAIEENGQMGESLVSIEYKNFLTRKVSQEEINDTKEVLEYLKDSKLNRRPQLKTDALKRIARIYNPQRPIILYFGQNDYESGIKPYSLKSQIYHSPIFESSDDAAHYLEKICKKNNWNFIYKPHQMMVRAGECLEEQFDKKTIWIGDSDIHELIDLADVCVTIVSQCGYVSLIREKPTVMLGYTQLKGKECCYEVTEKQQIEVSLKKALKKGYTEAQKENFQKHVAQMLKYYLFDDLQHENSFGQPVENAVSFIKGYLNDIQKQNDFSRKNVLFLCRTEFQVRNAIAINNNFNQYVCSDVIYVQNAERENQCLPDVFERTFVLTLDSDEIELREWLDEKMYDDLFISEYSANVIGIFEWLKIKNKQIKVHLFDSGEYQQYIKDIFSDISKAKNNNETHDFFYALSELSMCDRRTKLWKEKLTIPITVIPQSNDVVFESFETAHIIYVFCEGDFFVNRVVSNEVDIIERLSKMLSDELIVLRNEKNDLDIYSIYGYKTVKNILEIPQSGNIKMIVFAPYMNTFLYQQFANMEIIFIDVSKIVITNDKLIQSNSYKKLLFELENLGLNNYYQPDNYSEIREIIRYEGGKCDYE